MQAPSLRNRLVGGIGALLLQGLFLFVLVQSLPPLRSPPKIQQELTLILPPLRQAPDAPLPAPGLPGIGSPTVAPLQQGAAAPLQAAPPPSDLRNFGQALNGCAPELYASLLPDQQGRCKRPGEGVVAEQMPDLMGTRSHVKNEAYWKEEWARTQSPALLPCGGFVNLMCLLMKIADGTLSDYGDPAKWPHYAVKQLPPEDFYKVEQAYAAWHKDHPLPNR